MQVNTRNALGWGFKRPISLQSPYLYNEGDEVVGWEVGIASGNGSQSKEADHLYIEATQRSADFSYVTEVEVNFTGVNTLWVDWDQAVSNENIGPTNRSYLNVGGNSDSGRDTYDEQLLHIWDADPHARRQDSLDVSGLSGNYLVRVHGQGGDDFGGGSHCKLKVHKVWVE